MNKEDIALKFIVKYGVNVESRLANTIYHNIVSDDCHRLIEFDDNVFNSFESKYWYKAIKFNEIQNIKFDSIQIEGTNHSFFIDDIVDLARTISRSPFNDLIFLIPQHSIAPLCISKIAKEKVITRIYMIPTPSLIPSTTIDDPMFMMNIEQSNIDVDCNKHNRVNGLVVPSGITLIDENPLIGTIYPCIRNNGSIIARCLNCGMSIQLEGFTDEYDISNQQWIFNIDYLKDNHYGCRCSCTCYDCINWRNWIYREQQRELMFKQNKKRLYAIKDTTGIDKGD